MTTEEILNERQGQYGDFNNIAEYTRDATANLVRLRKHEPAPSVHLEAAHMILQKLARAFNGDINYKDTWDDIAGYAKLVSEYIEKNKQL